ncbi:MAG: phosphoglycerate kinase [Candidatus Diapherotrites archaeon]|nr:phosphoglycerate kinase [Candidatus Diapherotrites archaeon]
MHDYEKLPYINGQDLTGKTVLVRVDLNTSVQNGKITLSPRLFEHSNTLEDLSDRNAKVVAVSHQGRKDRDDFVSLEQHAEVLEHLTGKHVQFCSWDDDYISKIKELKNGNILVLDNTRFLDYETQELSAEEHAENPKVKELAKVCDMFVLDTLSVAHRSHALVVGLMPLLPSFIGPVLRKELKALKKIVTADHGSVLILGGAKVEESLEAMKKMLTAEKVDLVLLGGIPGELAIIAKGENLGKKQHWLQEKGYIQFVPLLKEFLERYEDRILIPVDFAVERNLRRKEISLAELPMHETIYDIGEVTAQMYASKLENAKLVIFNGPVGVFEKYQFSYGTRKLLSALADSRAFSVIGGGDTLTAISSLGFKEREFSHTSLAGKALLDFLAGNKVAALAAIEKYAPKVEIK